MAARRGLCWALGVQKDIMMLTGLSEGWQELNLFAKLAVLVLLLSLVPTMIAVWRIKETLAALRRTRASIELAGRVAGEPPRQVDAFSWAVLEVCVLLVALVMFRLGWRGSVTSTDCAGLACARAMAVMSRLPLNADDGPGSCSTRSSLCCPASRS